MRRRSSATTQRLLHAAAELIAELGWGRVTTRAIAARAGLPHGAVSYHFAGKHELLTEAATKIIEQALPLEELRAVPTLTNLLDVLDDRLGSRDAIDEVLSGVTLETMRESARDPVLGERMAALARDYRQLVAELASKALGHDPTSRDMTPADLAALIVAAGDGLLVHALIDPHLDISGAFKALRALVNRQTAGMRAQD